MSGAPGLKSFPTSTSNRTSMVTVDTEAGAVFRCLPALFGHPLRRTFRLSLKGVTSGRSISSPG